MPGVFVDDVLREFRRLRDLAEKAASQVPEDRWSVPIGEESNSIAVVMKHVGGNLRSRWTDFLTTDGEKPGRNRDAEFETEPADTRASVMDLWRKGWRRLFEAIEPLRPEDLARTVTIRGEPHTVSQAILRSFNHTAYHVGQIVLLARHEAGEHWKSLSIQRGGSDEFQRAMKDGRGTPYKEHSPGEES